MSRAAGRRSEEKRDEHDALEPAWKELLGQIRDLQTHWTEEDLTRVVNDNSGLKKQVRLLTNENTELQNKLAAARDTSGSPTSASPPLKSSARPQSSPDR